jgi:hypothetical protein
MEINLYHISGILRYGTVEGDLIHFDHCWYAGSHFLPVTKSRKIHMPIFQVKNGVYPTPEQWEEFLWVYRGRSLPYEQVIA